MTLPWFRIVGGGGMRHGRAPGQHVHGLARNLAVGREVRHREPPAEELAERRGLHDRAREEVRARLLPLLEHGDRDVAEPLPDVGMLLEQLAEPDRAREPAGPAADDERRRPRSARRADRSARRPRRSAPNGGAKSIGLATAPPSPRARTSSVSFGTIWCRSPTTPMSQKSKIGAFGSLLIATIVPEPCIPTLCWIAPEMPHAM